MKNNYSTQLNCLEQGKTTCTENRQFNATRHKARWSLFLAVELLGTTKLYREPWLNHREQSIGGAGTVGRFDQKILLFNDEEV